MQQHIGIAMTQRPFVMGNRNTPDPKLSPFDQLMKIYSRTNTKRHRLGFWQINKKAPVLTGPF
jgi:hypothetical protein